MIDLAFELIEKLAILATYGALCYFAGKKAQREDDIKEEG